MKRVIAVLLSVFFVAGVSGKEKDLRIYKYKLNSNDGEKVKIECEIEDGRCTISVTKDGKVEEYSFHLDSLDAIPELERLEDMGLKGLLFSLKDSKLHQDFDEEIRDFDIDIYTDMPFHDYSRTWLGVQIQPLTDQLRDYFKVKGSSGVLVTEVVKDSPAEKAGVEAGDVIISIDRKRIKNSGDLVDFIRKKDPGNDVTIKVVRNGKKETITATLDSRTPKKARRMYSVRPDTKVLPRFPMFEHLAPSLKNEIKTLKKELKELKEQMEELRKKMEEMKES